MTAMHCSAQICVSNAVLPNISKCFKILLTLSIFKYFKRYTKKPHCSFISCNHSTFKTPLIQCPHQLVTSALHTLEPMPTSQEICNRKMSSKKIWMVCFIRPNFLARKEQLKQKRYLKKVSYVSNSITHAVCLHE